MKPKTVNRIKTRTAKILVEKKTIEKKFKRLGNARDIRGSQVDRLAALLGRGQHFETPIMTHKVGEKHRLLDGNHRYEAMKRYLTRFPKDKIEVWVFYYTGLSEQQEKELYTKWNSGIRQSTTDFVKQYWDMIPINKMFEDNFPCKVGHKWGTNRIQFKLLVGAYLTLRDEKFAGGYCKNAMHFINDSKSLGKMDYFRIREYMNDFIFVYGMPNRKNPHYRSAFFHSMFRIWLDNIKNVNFDKMRKAMIKLRGHERVIYWANLGSSRGNTIQCYKDLLEALNGRRKKKLFL